MAEAGGGGLGGLEGAVRQFLPIDNELFAGGLGLGLMGAGLQLLRRGSSAAALLARRHLLMTLEVTSKDATYPWVLQWLNAHGRRTQHLSVKTALDRAVDGSSALRFDLVPGPGRHLVRYGGRYFLVERQREHQTVAMSSGEPWEKVLLTSVGRDVSVFDRLLEEARRMNERSEEDATVVYTFWGSEWRPFGHPRRRRRLDTVVLDDGVKEGIVEDLREWRDSAGWYRARGIPYRRGYLLHGPPGSGKTSFIVSLAGEIDYGICILSLSDEHMTDDRLAQSLSVVPQRCIVLLEDVDAAFGSRAAGDFDGTSRRGAAAGLTFSGLLNVLDGVASSEERLVFMTTNHLDRLDPALLRPGRVDVARLLGAATESQARRLFARFYDEDRDDAVDDFTASSLADDFAARVAGMDGAPSMAELQGHLMEHKGDPAGAVARTARLREKTEERAALVARQEAEARRRGSTAAGIDDSGGGERRRRGEGRRITAAEVDKMMFNPQPGWEEQCGLK